MTTIVYKVSYNAGGNDSVTVWLNPNLSLTEAEQNPALVTTFQANATFTEIHLREGGGGAGWTYSNIAIADTAWDTGFFAVPSDSDNDGLPDLWENTIIAHAAAQDPPVTLALADIKGPNVVRQADCKLSSFLRPRFTFSRISVADAVQINGFGSELWVCM